MHAKSHPESLSQVLRSLSDADLCFGFVVVFWTPLRQASDEESEKVKSTTLNFPCRWIQSPVLCRVLDALNPKPYNMTLWAVDVGIYP